MPDSVWSVAAAKAHLREVIDRATSTGPQTITRRGRAAAIVVSAEEWAKKTARTGSLVEFFASSPLRGSRLRVQRLKGGLRDVEL